MSVTLDLQKYAPLLRQLHSDQLDALQSFLERAQNDEDIEYVIQWVAYPEIWKQPPVSFDTFIDAKEFLNAGDVIYPNIRKIVNDILRGKYTEAVIVAGIGSGKTTSAELLACYLTHKLLCMRDLYSYYKLAKDKPIALINMGITATQALEVGFKGIVNFMKNSSWFMSFSPILHEGSIRFQPVNILLLSGNSKATTPLGYNVFYGFLDEAAFYLNNENKNVAEDIYSSLQRRVVSRFGYDGLVVLVSSPKYENDFIMKKLDEAKKSPDLIYGIQIPTWKSKPVKKDAELKSFFFDVKEEKVLAQKPTFTDKIGYLSASGFDYSARVWEIPGEYKKSFRQNPQKAKRDFAAMPAKTVAAFMPQKDFILAMFNGEESPVKIGAPYDFKERPLRTEYYIHVDLANNKNGKGDKGGFAMAHFDRWETDKETGEQEPVVVIDLAEQLEAGPTGEIEFSDVRQKIYTLKKMGYNIKLVTFDQFQSVDSQQILRRKGVRSGLLSVDRTIDPYDTFKVLIYDGRVICHEQEKLKEELMGLEEIKGKVDHPPNGSKDIADAACGAVFNVMIKGLGSGLNMATINAMTAIPVHLMNKEQKTAYYIRLQERKEEGSL